MANMILNNYTFALDPARVTGLDADSLFKPKVTATADTLTSQILFQWVGVTAGQEIVLEWERMDTAMWDALQTMAESVSTYALNPQIGGTTFTVAVIKLEAQGRDPAGMRGVRLTVNVRS
jgi:hypothetical protein